MPRRGVLSDLKSVQDASPEGFAQGIANYRWHRQAAFYLDGCEMERFNFIAVAMVGNSFIESDHQAVIRMDTHQVLAVHGPGYNLITNQEVFGAFDEALGDSVLDKTDMYYRDEVAYNGARAVRT